MKVVGLLVQCLLLPLPWTLRRLALRLIFKFEIAKSARIGMSILGVRHLFIGEGARIGHFNIVRNLEFLSLNEFSTVGNLNWISGGTSDKRFFHGQPPRRSELIVKRHGAITSRHIFDCTDGVCVGEYATVGGWASQILTHSIDVAQGRQTAGPVVIEDFAFLGTRVVILKNSVFPRNSVLAAGSVYSGRDGKALHIYSGIPAIPRKAIAPDSVYFTRAVGEVL